MRSRVILSLLFVTCILYSSVAFDETGNDEVIVSKQDPGVTSLIRKIDRVKTDGDMERLDELLDEYDRIKYPGREENREGKPEVRFEPSDGSVTQGRWSGDAVIIDNAYAYFSTTMDTRGDSHIYIAASRKEHSGEEIKMPVWHSTDGINWIYWGSFVVSGANIFSPSMEIVEKPDSDYLFIAFSAKSNTTPFCSDIIVLKYNLTSYSWSYKYLPDASCIESGPSLDSDDLCYPVVPYLHLSYMCGDSIIYTRSLDLGETWVDRVVLGAPGTSYKYTNPSCAYGWGTPLSDSFNLGVAWIYYTGNLNDRRIRFKANYYKGSYDSWLSTSYFAPPEDNIDYSPELKLTRHGDPSAMIAFNRQDTLNTDYLLCGYYTYDGGKTWSEETYYDQNGVPEPELAVDDSLGFYHMIFHGVGNDMYYLKGEYDDFSYPGGWSALTKIYDKGDYSILYEPASAVLDNQPCIVWSAYQPSAYDTLKFNAEWFETGITEKENEAKFTVSSNIIYTSENLRFSHEGVEIFDISGRRIRIIKGDVWDLTDSKGIKVDAGVYFIKSNTTGARVKVVLFK